MRQISPDISGTNSLPAHLWRRIGFTQRPCHAQLVQRTQLEVGGTLLAARKALEHGMAGWAQRRKCRFLRGERINSMEKLMESYGKCGLPAWLLEMVEEFTCFEAVLTWISFSPWNHWNVGMEDGKGLQLKVTWGCNNVWAWTYIPWVLPLSRRNSDLGTWFR